MKLKTRIIVGFMLVALIPLILFTLALYEVGRTQTANMQEQREDPLLITMPDTEYDIIIDTYMVEKAHVRLSSTEVLIAAFLILIGTALVVGIWIYQSVAAPLYRLKEAARHISEGNLDFQMDHLKDDEIGELCQDFEEMRLRLKGSAEEKVRLDQEHQELVSNISHDLRTPLTAIKGYVEGIMDGVADTPEKMEQYLQTIYHKTDEMDHLIHELTVYARIDTNRIPYTFEKLPVKDFFDAYAEQLQVEMATEDVLLTYTNEVEEGIMIADAEQLKRVMHNIIGNSMKYRDPEKEQTVISLRIKDAEDFVQVEIEDNGTGVPKKNLQYIFDRFYRTDASRNSSRGGSGLGLSIVKKIIEDHGGRVWAASEEGRGTTVFLVIRKYRTDFE